MELEVFWKGKRLKKQIKNSLFPMDSDGNFMEPWKMTEYSVIFSFGPIIIKHNQ